MSIPRSPASSGAQTADRAIRLLLLVGNSEMPLSISDLSRLAGLNRGATARLVRVLESHFLVAREASGRRFVVGSGVLRLAAAARLRFSIREAARPVMNRAAKETSETVSLHVRQGSHRACIDVIEGRLPIRRVVPVGETAELLASPSGKVLLAFSGSAAVTEIVNQEDLDAKSVTLLSRQLARIRDQGYYASTGERFPGVSGLSIPICDASGIAAVLTISGPTDRFSSTAVSVWADSLCAACGELSASLGWSSEADTEVTPTTGVGVSP